MVQSQAALGMIAILVTMSKNVKQRRDGEE
jgi:hypothetical protein